MNNLPKPRSIWRHHSGRCYTIIILANEHSTDLDKFPVYPVYQGSNGRVWTRPVKDFMEKMKWVCDARE